ncbi:MAG: hypothetical protein SFW36_16490 [Leptolyngbyaceae cyanobacterium bins.59]|nr:hypothetical protein [Leptolyngbyaceae cyanobacterium bins.59]
MTFFRQYISPLLIVLVFLVALLAVSARIFLPSDMAAPAPVEGVGQVSPRMEQVAREASGSNLPTALSTLIKGLPEDL